MRILLALFAATSAHAFCKSSGFTVPFGGVTCYNAGGLDSHIDPYAANSGAGSTPDSNWVYWPDAAHALPTPTLLLFLPGHGADADDYTEFLKEAMAQGYYVIGLAYQNGKSIQELCGYWPDCAGQLLEQNVSGTPHGFYSSLETSWPQADNSINYRLGAALPFIALSTGDSNWNLFYNQTTHNVSWSRIVIAGHSEGGGTAAWIVKNRGVIGGLTFEAPYSMLDNANSTNGDGVPSAGSGFTPYFINNSLTASNTTATNYLHNDSSNWVNKMWMTLNTWDKGYDNTSNDIYFHDGDQGICAKAPYICDVGGNCRCTIPTWLGVNMSAAGTTLNKTEMTMLACPASIGGHKWWTSTVRPTGPTCSGHGATVSDGCYPSWMPCYWDEILQAVRQ